MHEGKIPSNDAFSALILGLMKQREAPGKEIYGKEKKFSEKEGTKEKKMIFFSLSLTIFN